MRSNAPCRAARLPAPRSEDAAGTVGQRHARYRTRGVSPRGAVTAGDATPYPRRLAAWRDNSRERKGLRGPHGKRSTESFFARSTLRSSAPCWPARLPAPRSGDAAGTMWERRVRHRTRGVSPRGVVTVEERKGSVGRKGEEVAHGVAFCCAFASAAQWGRCGYGVPAPRSEDAAGTVLPAPRSETLRVRLVAVSQEACRQTG